ncbi:unnamed protein product [Owenia fusiformis]|uniref:Uncharacterized protein n=1 Tax=Owenia fusiformis TaxID=6347 RepID=A0A8J1T7E1_OWEFU|nr:unnamed protein product [Owenia fusiformis]
MCNSVTKDLVTMTMDQLANTSFTDDPVRNVPLSEIFHLAKNYNEYKIGAMIHRYWPMVILPFGLVGNLLAFLVMTRKQSRQKSTCIYMAVLSVTDTVSLFILLYHWIVTNFVQLPITEYHNDINCKILSYISQVTTEYGVSVIIAMTIDRYIAVKYPIHSVTWCSLKRTRRILVIGIIILSIYNIPIPWMSGSVEWDICATFNTQDDFTAAYSWIYIIFGSVFPVVALMCFNTLIIRSIRDQSKKILNLRVGQGHSRSQSNASNDSRLIRQSSKETWGLSRGDIHSRQRQLTLMLLLVTFTFILLTLPQYIRYTLYVTLDYHSSAKLYALYTLIYHISNKLWFTNCAVNFYLYCLVGEKFRRDLKTLFSRESKRPIYLELALQFGQRSTPFDSRRTSAKSSPVFAREMSAINEELSVAMETTIVATDTRNNTGIIKEQLGKETNGVRKYKNGVSKYVNGETKHMNGEIHDSTLIVNGVQ